MNSTHPILPMAEPPLPAGIQFQGRSGHRAIYNVGDIVYLQRERRKYMCRIIEAHSESYRDRWKRLQRRSVFTAEVMQN